MVRLVAAPSCLRLYRRRWIVLATVALLNNSNTMAWIAFASIANHVNVFYGNVSFILVVL